MPDNVHAAALFSLAAIASARYRRAAEARLRPTGLTWAQFGALSALAEAARSGSGLSQAELAHALETDSTTAMVLRGSLERKGFVERRDDPRDGRVKRLTLTTQGRRALVEALPKVAVVLAGLTDQFSDAELKRSATALGHLADLGKEAETAASPRKAEAAIPAKRGRPRKEKAGAGGNAKGVGRKRAKASGAAKAVRTGRAATKTAGARKVGKAVKASAGKTTSSAKKLKPANAGTAGRGKPAAKKAAKTAPKASRGAKTARKAVPVKGKSPKAAARKAASPKAATSSRTVKGKKPKVLASRKSSAKRAKAVSAQEKAQMPDTTDMPVIGS